MGSGDLDLHKRSSNLREVTQEILLSPISLEVFCLPVSRFPFSLFIGYSPIDIKKEMFPFHYTFFYHLNEIVDLREL